MLEPGAEDDLLACAAAFDSQLALPETPSWPRLRETEQEAFALLAAVARLGREAPDRTPIDREPLRPEDREPERWGPFEILGPQGAGGFSRVYRAYDERLDRLVALKLLHPPRHGSAEELAARRREGRLLARLDHPNIVRVHAAEEHGGVSGLVMSLVEGETLAAIVARGPLPVPEVLRLGRDLCRALGALHAARIVHRDLKAENVLRGADGGAVLVDFGIGVDLDRHGEASTVSGTPLYMAPELFSGAPPTPTSDLYSLGVLLFHLLAGRFPIEAETLIELRTRAERAERPPLVSLRRGLPRRLRRLVEHCLDPQPSRRPASAAAVEAELVRLLRPRPVRLLRTFGGVTATAGLVPFLGLLGVWLGADPVTTTSPLARSYYALGEAANELGYQPLTLRFAELAVAADPTFASGHALAALAASAQGRAQEAASYAQAAGLYAPRAEARAEWLQITTVTALYAGRYAESLEAALALRTIRPHATTYLRQGVQAGQQLGRFAEALELQREVFGRSPTANNAGELVSLLLDVDRLPEAAAVLERAEARDPGRSYLAWVRGVVELARGDEAAARAAFTRLAAAEDDFLADAGRAWLGEIELADGARPNLAPPPALAEPYWAARLALAHARQAAAEGDLAPLAACRAHLGPSAHSTWLRAFGRLAARHGDRAGLAAALEALRGQDQATTQARRAARLQLEAETARLAGDLAGAARALVEAERGWWRDLELALSRLTLLEDQGDTLGAAELHHHLCQIRRHEFLNRGSWLERQQLCEPLAERHGIGGKG